ncbi:SRPBCC family protein [Geodermatophilus sp. DSM 44513]|uniref:SRPBCC family protein n=1 Tax=Geodermatophilus sp. DSM 44513 TaxID=1528104 RepID=UPI0037BF329B
MEAPVEGVWEVLRDVKRWPEWAPTVTCVQRLDQAPLAVGCRSARSSPGSPNRVRRDRAGVEPLVHPGGHRPGASAPPFGTRWRGSRAAAHA